MFKLEQVFYLWVGNSYREEKIWEGGDEILDKKQDEKKKVHAKHKSKA